MTIDAITAPEPAITGTGSLSRSEGLFRFATAGSVDDGKSTLVGRLLHDAKAILADQLEQVAATSRQRGFAHGDFDFALLTDGLRAEREQGITIDVAYRYFSTGRRSFILADCPGHVQYTRNMVTGSATADAVDKGRGGQIYNIVDDWPQSFGDYVREMAAELHRPRPLPVSPRLFGLIAPYGAGGLGGHTVAAGQPQGQAPGGGAETGLSVRRMGRRARRGGPRRRPAR